MRSDRRHPSIPNSLTHRGPSVADRLVAALPTLFIVAGALAAVAILRMHDAATSHHVQALAGLGFLGTLVIARLAHAANRGLVVTTAVMLVSFAATRSLGSDARSILDPGPGDGLAEILATTCLLALVTMLVTFVWIRRGSGLRSIVADTLLLTLVGWMVSWVLLIQPTLDRSSAPAWMVVLRGTTRAMALPAVFLLVLAFFSGVRRTPAILLIVGGCGAAMLGNVLAGLVDAGRLDWTEGKADSFYVVGILLGSAAFAHRSIGRLAEPVPWHRSHSPLTRVLLTVACLPVPAALLTLTHPHDSGDQYVRVVGLLLLSLAIAWRVADAIHTNNVAHSNMIRHAQQDALTGLPNRTLLTARITEALDAAHVVGARPTVMFIGLDRFKNVNDSLGHDIGDEVLRLVGRRLQTAMPRQAHIGRISGDEFVVLDPTVRTMAEASRLADRALALFREPLHIGAGDMYVMASIGVAVAPRGAIDPQELQRNADTAMCRAKEAGGNCVQVFDDAMYERVFHRLELESGLHRALERRELHLYYQPIVDLISGEVTGFEALMRWQLADGRVISPAEFIPVAEETGLIVGIGNWALLEALTQLRQWIDDGTVARTATMSVNVSPRQLQDPSLFSAVDEALRRSGVLPRNVWLEVTESVMISEPDQALAALRRLRGLDVRIAIDDFGTGYSSLSLLRNFPLQRIKIDRSFIAGMTADENSDALVRTIVAMARSLNLDLVAEGLESRDQLRALTAMGCRKAQGFLIASPVQASAMRETVRTLGSAGLWTGGLQLSWPDE